MCQVVQRVHGGSLSRVYSITKGQFRPWRLLPFPRNWYGSGSVIGFFVVDTKKELMGILEMLPKP